MTRVPLNPRRGRDVDKPLNAPDDEESAHPWPRRLRRHVWVEPVAVLAGLVLGLVIALVFDP